MLSEKVITITIDIWSDATEADKENYYALYRLANLLDSNSESIEVKSEGAGFNVK